LSVESRRSPERAIVSPLLSWSIDSRYFKKPCMFIYTSRSVKFSTRSLRSLALNCSSTGS